jgi:integrase/recombinase XerD
LLATASALKSDRGLRGQTYYCLLGLLAVSGLRISEALGLEQQDVNLEQGWLTIRGAKFGKSRLVPLHQSTRDVLGDMRSVGMRSFLARSQISFFDPKKEQR